MACFRPPAISLLHSVFSPPLDIFVLVVLELIYICFCVYLLLCLGNLEIDVRLKSSAKLKLCVLLYC